ncbi:hypothetical protein GA0070622_0039 [Micromonospora sediminicola]|uniref:Uncharacterized protein n=1 Tax=Micromonospora sediminicola TaxID=946078 RepID=A0A1A9B246_9ACTN|nr:hypothetical protein GA0070622_0039 [Micromonospora sediminicola]
MTVPGQCDDELTLLDADSDVRGDEYLTLRLAGAAGGAHGRAAGARRRAAGDRDGGPDQRTRPGGQ